MLKPPFHFSKVISAHLIMWSFFYSVVEPQMKLRWIWSIFLVILQGSLVTCIRCVERLFKQAFAKVVLPAIIKSFVFHPASLDFMLSNMDWKSVLDVLFCVIGNPKYLPKFLPFFIPSYLEIVWLKVFGQFQEKISLDLEVFTACPEDLQNSSINLLTCWQHLFSTRHIRTRSSIKNKWENLGPLFEIFIGVQFFS